MKETPSGATRQCRRSSFTRDEARSGQERAKSIANLIERSFKTEFTRGPGRGDTCHLSFLDETLPD